MKNMPNLLSLLLSVGSTCTVGCGHHILDNVYMENESTITWKTTQHQSHVDDYFALCLTSNDGEINIFDHSDN